MGLDSQVVGRANPATSRLSDGGVAGYFPAVEWRSDRAAPETGALRGNVRQQLQRCRFRQQ